MTDRPDIVLQALASGGLRARAIDRVLCRLVIEGAELGALDEIVATGADGQPQTINVPPREWIARLGRAIELGVLDHPTPAKVRKVVDSHPGAAATGARQKLVQFCCVARPV